MIYNSTKNDSKGYLAGSFQKVCIIADDKTVRFKHEGSDYHLTSPCFDGLEGKEVLIDAGLSVTRGGKQIGRATRA